MSSKPKLVRISEDMLTKLVDRLEANASRSKDHPITESDAALIDEARHLLRPSFQQTVDAFEGWSLEQLRMGREVSLKNGNTVRAFALATAIDRKRGLY